MHTRWSFVLGIFSSPLNFFDGCFARAGQQQQHTHKTTKEINFKHSSSNGYSWFRDKWTNLQEAISWRRVFSWRISYSNQITERKYQHNHQTYEPFSLSTPNMPLLDSLLFHSSLQETKNHTPKLPLFQNKTHSNLKYHLSAKPM